MLPSLYSLHSWQGDMRTTTKTMRQVLGPVVLPLHVSWTAAPAPNAGTGGAGLEAEGAALGRQEAVR